MADWATSLPKRTDEHTRQVTLIFINTNVRDIENAIDNTLNENEIFLEEPNRDGEQLIIKCHINMKEIESKNSNMSYHKVKSWLQNTLDQNLRSGRLVEIQ